MGIPTTPLAQILLRPLRVTSQTQAFSIRAADDLSLPASTAHPVRRDGACNGRHYDPQVGNPLRSCPKVSKPPATVEATATGDESRLPRWVGNPTHQPASVGDPNNAMRQTSRHPVQIPAAVPLRPGGRANVRLK